MQTAKGIKRGSLILLHEDGNLPAKGYDSVNLPSGLYNKVKALVACRDDLGYRSVTEFVADAVRKRTEEIEKTHDSTSQSEK